ncbi:unnamed protein product [Allacma fusca]|uniref:Uncharacterized protein n=1 Tax=Allacma fusca TaxID=39272 RepID=A0A8J2PJF3_9HEXA|nr:unnamed protein product [Allacma fusca]
MEALVASVEITAVLAGAFHGVKKIKSWTGWPKSYCKLVSPQGFESSGTTFTHRQGDNMTADSIQDQKDEEFFTLSCSGLDDPLHFYLAAVRTLESAILILIFFMGLAFGKSNLGGNFAVAIFVFLHPQRSNYDWIFPVQEKIGWILVLLQIYTLFRTMFCKVHPHWSSVVKIAISTAVLILGWNTDAQWFLTSQLIIVVILHFCGGLSRYIASLVILGQLTGWQYASLVSIDPSLHHWSFFMYTLLACLVTVVLIEPIVDWILGRKRDKWKFFRGSILLITFQTILISVRCDLGQLFAFLEDSRFPLTIGDSQEGMKPWTTNMKVEDLTQEIPLQNFDVNIFESRGLNLGKESNARINENSAGTQNLPHLSGNTKWANELNQTESARVLSLQLTEFLRSCFICQGKSCYVKFLSKYFFLIFAATYTLIVAVLFPICFPSLRGSSNGAVKEKEELWDFQEPNKIKNAWNPLYCCLLLFGESDDDERCTYSSGEDDDDKFQHLFSSNKMLRRGRSIKSDTLWLWESYLSYHIAQTVFFALFCLWLDERWEIFFVPHVCLLLALLCDFRRVSKLLKTNPFSYAFHVHWGAVFVIVAILVANARLRSNAVYQKSRGRFEIGNPRVGGLMEALKWIRENTESSAGFAGADNIMVALELSSQRNSVSHHLTVHCWANENERKHEDKEQRLHDKLPKSKPPRTNTHQAQVPIRERATAEIERDEIGLKDEDDEREEMRGEKSSTPLDSKLGARNLGEGHIGKETIQVTMTSRLTSQEMAQLVKVYSVYSRNKSIYTFHNGLISLNVSYFILSQQMCPELSSKEYLTTRSSNAQIFPPDEGQKEMEQQNFSIYGIWQWHWNWQQPIDNQESQLLSLHFPKRCDFVRFWDDVERKQELSGKAGRDQNQYSYAKVHSTVGRDAKFKIQSRTPGFNNRGRSASRGEEPNVRGKDGHTYSNIAEDTLCYRFIKERNILPFKRVFQNTFFTILAV